MLSGRCACGAIRFDVEDHFVYALLLPLRGVSCRHRLGVQRGRRHRAHQTGRSQRRGPHPAVRAARRRTRQLLRQLRLDRVFVRAPRRVRARAARNACSRRLRCGRRFTSASRRKGAVVRHHRRAAAIPASNHPRACSVGPRTHSHRLCCRRKAAGPNTRGVCSACSTTSINTWTKCSISKRSPMSRTFRRFTFTGSLRRGWARRRPTTCAAAGSTARPNSLRRIAAHRCSALRFRSASAPANRWRARSRRGSGARRARGAPSRRQRVRSASGTCNATHRSGRANPDRSFASEIRCRFANARSMTAPITISRRSTCE